MHLLHLLIEWVVYSVGLLIAAHLIPGFKIKSFGSAMIAVIVRESSTTRTGSEVSMPNSLFRNKNGPAIVYVKGLLLLKERCLPLGTGACRPQVGTG